MRLFLRQVPKLFDIVKYCLALFKEHPLAANRIPSSLLKTGTLDTNKAASLTEPPRSSWPYLLLLSLILFGTLANLNAQAPGAAVSYLPPMGGPGGGQYQAQCGPTENLTGFELRVGEFIDAIRPVCVVTYGATSMGNQRVASDWFGGGQRTGLNTVTAGVGGHPIQLLCPKSTPILIGIDAGLKQGGYSATAITDIYTVLASIHLFCGQAIPVQKMPDLPNAIFDAPATSDTIPGLEHQGCPAGQVAVGVHGRAGNFLDAVGLICGAPRKDTSGVALGRVQPTTPAVAMSICDRAKDARARNSPVAAQLESQCTASQGPPKVLGRTGTPSSGMPVPICDQAQSALARNSPVAPELVARCKAIGGGQGMPVEMTPDQLAARGQFLPARMQWLLSCATSAGRQSTRIRYRNGGR